MFNLTDINIETLDFILFVNSIIQELLLDPETDLEYLTVLFKDYLTKRLPFVFNSESINFMADQ